MNSPWIDAREQPPKLGEILAVFEGGQRGYLSLGKDDTVFHRKILYWMPFPEVPKPDPFEDWLESKQFSVAMTTNERQRECFYAGVQWARSHPETDDAWKKAPGQRE